MSSSKVVRDVRVVSVTLKCRSMICCCVLAISYNTPRLSPCATWDSDGITFINSSTGSSNPSGILVAVDGVIHVAMSNPQEVQLWTEENSVPTMNLTINSSAAYVVFVTSNRDVYFRSGDLGKTVSKRSWNATSSITVMNMNKTCFGLFVDVVDNLYCSFEAPDRVVRKSPHADINDTVVVAGSGTSGSAPNMLSGPRGIFVDTEFILHVADCYNNRVQRLSHGQSNGITVAGSGAPGTIALSLPSGVILDGNGYLYITDHNSHRVVASGPLGFRCIIACTGATGSGANQLHYPVGLSFDSHGNLFVSDTANYRVQKFLLSNNSCGE